MKIGVSDILISYRNRSDSTVYFKVNILYCYKILILSLSLCPYIYLMHQCLDGEFQICNDLHCYLTLLYPTINYNIFPGSVFIFRPRVQCFLTNHNMVTTKDDYYFGPIFLCLHHRIFANFIIRSTCRFNKT